MELRYYFEIIRAQKNNGARGTTSYLQLIEALRCLYCCGNFYSWVVLPAVSSGTISEIVGTIKIYIENIKKLELDDESKELMLGGNAKRLLGI